MDFQRAIHRGMNNTARQVLAATVLHSETLALILDEDRAEFIAEEENADRIIRSLDACGFAIAPKAAGWQPIATLVNRKSCTDYLVATRDGAVRLLWWSEEDQEWIGDDGREGKDWIVLWFHYPKPPSQADQPAVG
jgi:hypothetical protein